MIECVQLNLVTPRSTQVRYGITDVVDWRVTGGQSYVVFRLYRTSTGTKFTFTATRHGGGWERWSYLTSSLPKSSCIAHSSVNTSAFSAEFKIRSSSLSHPGE